MESLFGSGFDTYRSIASEEYRSVIENGLVVLDANALLGLYRYHPKTRADFLGLYARIGDRLWIPHHVMFEFFERRVSVIDARLSFGDVTIADLSALTKKCIERLAQWANRMSLTPSDSEKVISLMTSTVRQIERDILNFSSDDSLEGAEDTSRDPVLRALSPIIEDRIGNALSTDELREAKVEARRRIEDCRPPGFMDANKKGDNAEGDYLIWYETLSEAKRRNTDVLFVTGDRKKDWWRIERGQAKGPRWELVAELEALTGRHLYMLEPASLAEHAPQPLPKESVQEAKRVSSKASIGWRPRPNWGTVRNYVERARDDGNLDITYSFVYDDGSGVKPLALSNSSRISELGEFARGILSSGHLSIKVTPHILERAEKHFEKINALDADKREQLFLDTNDLSEDAGWAWTPDHRLVKAAPGLNVEASY